MQETYLITECGVCFDVLSTQSEHKEDCEDQRDGAKYAQLNEDVFLTPAVWRVETRSINGIPWNLNAVGWLIAGTPIIIILIDDSVSSSSLDHRLIQKVIMFVYIHMYIYIIYNN